ncbi:amidohydrolase [Sciscionella marina]|uniref:amidohydrolase n=1 Tax=Sciscionella marina TaxID=508770 RepID=UPI000372FD3A|nr:amidohydrolase [Sciscionella marina]
MLIDTIFGNGRFHTLDPARPQANRIGVLHGRIAGLDEELDGVRAERVIDLAGAPVVPGFNDAHQHLSMRGQRLRQLDLRPVAVSTVDDIYAAVAARAAQTPAGQWILGSGYDQNKTGAHPDRSRLDAVAGGHPVWLGHCSGHMGVANSTAFARMGFPDPGTVPDVDGGSVSRDAQGIPDGLLAERAQELVHALLRPYAFADFVEAIRIGSEVAAAEGITSFAEPGIGSGGLAGNGAADLAAFTEASRSGKLRQRATLMPIAAALHEAGAFEPGGAAAEPWFGLDLGLRSGFGDDRVRIGPVKVFSDGSLIRRTAAMCEHYQGEPGNSGFLQQPAIELRELILRAHRFGWQIATHAIGDAAVQEVLDAYAEAQRTVARPDARHRIEHCGLTSPEQVARIAELGVIPVPQGRFIGELGDGMLEALGVRRAGSAYRLRSFLDAGSVLPGSSDSPVVAAAPLLGIHDMVNRRTDSGVAFGADEAIEVAQALRAYTLGSAYAEHTERDKGSLERGKLADFVVLDADPFTVAPDRLSGIGIGATVIGGEPVYENGALHYRIGRGI